MNLFLTNSENSEQIVLGSLLRVLSLVTDLAVKCVWLKDQRISFKQTRRLALYMVCVDFFKNVQLLK